MVAEDPIRDAALDHVIGSGTLLEPRNRTKVLAAIGEFERDLIVERTKAGVAAARRRGRVPGRPRVLEAEQVARARVLASNGSSIRRIAELLGCSPASVHRALRSAA